jgi:hypothetical protein
MDRHRLLKSDPNETNLVPRRESNRGVPFGFDYSLSYWKLRKTKKKQISDMCVVVWRFIALNIKKTHATFTLKTLSLPNTRGEGAGCGPSRGAARPRGGGDRRGAALRADRQHPPLLVVQAAGRAASGKIEGAQRQLGGPLGG